MRSGPANGPTDLEVLDLKMKYKQAKHSKEIMRAGKAHRVLQGTPAKELCKVEHTCTVPEEKFGVQIQPGLYKETLSQKEKKNEMKE